MCWRHGLRQFIVLRRTTLSALLLLIQRLVQRHQTLLQSKDCSLCPIGKMQFGYTRWLAEGRGVRLGLGGSVGLSVLPQALEPFYGGRSAGEFSVFFTIRPQSKE